MQLKSLMPDIYKLIPYDYAAIRKPEYDRLLDLYMSRAKASKQPVFVQVSGIPGAGKSTFCAHNRWNKDKLFISFDAIMNNLPAYQLDSYRLGLAESFKKWELPARIIGYELLRRAIKARSDIYLEHSGVNSAHIQLVESLRKQGYQTEVHFILCDLAEAQTRAQEREKIIHRHTPPELITERYNLVDTYLKTYTDKLDRLYVYESANNQFTLCRNYQKGILLP